MAMTELIGSLVSQLGIQEGQAKGGAGLLFKLDSGMVTKFVPIILGFVKGQGGQGIADLLTRVLK